MAQKKDSPLKEFRGLKVPEGFFEQEAQALFQPLEEQSFLERTGEQAALPAALSTTGTLLGGLAGPGTALTLEAAGGGIGEAINQAVGISEPSMTQIGLAASAGPAFQLLRTGAKFLGPMTKGARLLNRFAFEDAESLMQRFVPERAAQELFKVVDVASDPISMSRTMKALNGTEASEGLIQQLSSRASPPPILKKLTKLRDKIAQSTDSSLVPKELQRELEALGEQISRLEKQGGSGLGAVKKTFNAMIADLDDVVEKADRIRNPRSALGAAALQEARRATLRAKSVDELGDLINQHFIVKRGQGSVGESFFGPEKTMLGRPRAAGGGREFNPAAVIRALEGDTSTARFFKKAFSETDQKEIKETLQKLNSALPPLAPAVGQKFGSGLFGGRIGSFTAGGAGVGAAAEAVSLGGLEGMTGIGAGLGAGTGLILAPVVDIGRTIAKALSMKSGRQFIGNMLSAEGGTLGPASMSLLAAFLRAAGAQVMSERPRASQRAEFVSPNK